MTLIEAERVHRRIRGLHRGVRRRIERSLQSLLPPARLFGVNVVGHISGDTGLGEAVRSNIRAMRAAGIPLALRNYENPRVENTDRTYAAFSRSNPYDVNLVQVNPNRDFAVRGLVGDGFYAWKHNVAFWVWEMPQFPERFLANFGLYDEVWTPSRFSRDAIASAAPVPVHVVPHSIVRPRPGNAAGMRRSLRIAPETRVFLFTFDYGSNADRKNPLGLIRSFSKAFRADDDVLLVIKGNHPHLNPAAAEAVRSAAAEGRRIRLIERSLPKEDLWGLFAACDAYVSLHRSEGFGLTLAEAMALGKPVIATGYSGNTDFMDEDNSLLVRFKLVPLKRRSHPYEKGWTWAEPDLDHAAELMKTVHRGPAAARALGLKARTDVEARLGPRVIGKLIEARLRSVHPGPSHASGGRPALTCNDLISTTNGVRRAAPASKDGPAAAPPREFGVNVSGLITSETGLGEAARANIRAIQAASIPHALTNFRIPLTGVEDSTYDGFTGENPYYFNLLQFNPDREASALLRLGPSYFKWKRNIGFWYWEASEFPARHIPNFGFFHEIWVGSEFTRAAVARVSPVPVLKVPPSLDIERKRTRADRERFGLSPHDFVFLSVFDFGSHFRRKNPIAVVRAFRRAFPGRGRAVLVLKTSHASEFPEAMKELAASCGTARIRFVNEALPRNDLYGLMACADAYVSLHRLEGFGLPIAEAMALGKPAIATAFSGNLEFMNPGNSFLVRHRNVALKRDDPPYLKGWTWAEPDVDHAASLMRALCRRPALARGVARKGQDEILRQLDPARIGSLIKERLLELYPKPDIRIP